MTVRVEGVLRTPINTPAANIPIKIITTIGAGETLSSAEVTYVTDASGNYGFDLVYATHEIYAMFDDAFELIGTSVANESVPTPTNINDLLHFSTPIQPEIVDKIYDDIYGCIDDLENDINTCMTCMSDQVVQGDTGVCQAMTVYTNDCLQACSAELTTAIQAGDAQTLSQSQAYTDATGAEIACCTEILSTSMSQLCTTMVASTEANGCAIAALCTDMEAGDASIIQSSKAYTDACTGNIEASITNMVRACDAAAYVCMTAISCCVEQVEDGATTTYRQDSPPGGANKGDVWYDTDDDNKAYRWNPDAQEVGETYTINVQSTYGYGYVATLSNSSPNPFIVRGTTVELFAGETPDNKTLMWFDSYTTPGDITPLTVRTGGNDYVLTWDNSIKSFASADGVNLFTSADVGNDIDVEIIKGLGVWEPVDDTRIEMQQSGYGIVTCAGDAVASIELLATSYSNTDVACAEILMRADKIAMHNGDATATTYPFYVEGDNVYMNCAMVNCLEGVEITSGILCAGEITAAIIQSAGFNSCSNPAGGAPQGYCLGAGGDAELNNVVIRGVIDGSVICGSTICGGVIKGSAIQSSYIATDVPSLTLTWANQEQYGSMDLTVICNQGNTPYMGYQSGVAASCTTTTPNLKIASYDYTGKTNYTRYTRRYITPYANGSSQLIHSSSKSCCYNVCCNDYAPVPAYNDGGVSICLCFRGTGTDRRIDSGTLRNGQSVTKVSGNTCVVFSATAYCCVQRASFCQGTNPPTYNTQIWVETGYHVYANVKKHDYCANVQCFCTSLYTNASARSHRLCDAANNATMPTSGGPS